MQKKPQSQLIVIFGASGDLTSRKLMPAIYDLYRQNLLDDNIAVLGVGRTALNDTVFCDKIGEGIREFAQTDTQKCDLFLKTVHYLSIDTKKSDDYILLSQEIVRLVKLHNLKDNILFYYATPPEMFEIISNNLKTVGLVKEPKEGYRRVIVEKPFGVSLDTAKRLNKSLAKVFNEQQIYRIDHYLGKETVQNLMVTRFTNVIFEPVWNRNYISSIEILASENIGIGSRGGYYDNSGAIRDMFQNHILQLLALVAMESPAVIESDAIRNEILKVLQSVDPFEPKNIEHQVVRGQYTHSQVKGKPVKGYRDEVGVPADSRTETFLAAKLTINNWRWAGVPFYVRTGKYLPTRVTEIVINFHHTPHHLFHANKSVMKNQNQLIIRIQPDEGLMLNFGMKLPGAGYEVKNVAMDFHYNELTEVYLPSAYERLLLDCALGDQTLFARADVVEEAWKIVQPILDAWQSNPDIALYGYPAGTWGPKEVESILMREDEHFRYPCKNLANSELYCEL